MSTSTRLSNRSAHRPHPRAAAPRALAIAAHPDDIEFVMAGTLLLLQRAGWEIHYLNVANGNMGSLTIPPVKLAQTRRDEARTASQDSGRNLAPPDLQRPGSVL